MASEDRSADKNERGSLSLDDILTRLNSLEAASRGEATPTPTSHLVADNETSAKAAPVAESVKPKPSDHPTDRPSGTYGIVFAPAERIQTPPSSAPTPPTDAEDTRYGRRQARWPSRIDHPIDQALAESAAGHEARPDPVDISLAPEDEIDIQPAMTQTKQLDFKTIVIAVFYLAIILFAIAAAIYI